MASYGDFLLAQAPTPAQDLQLADSGNTQPDWYSMLMPGDQFDTAKMQGNTAGPDQSVPWWEDAIKYGITRIIDNTTGPTNLQGNTSPGSFAGANGKTYPQDVAKQTAVKQQQSGMGLLLLIGVGYLLLEH